MLVTLELKVVTGATFPKVPRSICLFFLATVGLGFSDFGYRIFISVVSVVSCMDWGHGFGA